MDSKQIEQLRNITHKLACIVAPEGELYFHPKTGNIYQLLSTHPKIGFEAAEGKPTPVNPQLLAADDIHPDDHVVVYQNVETFQTYVRLAGKFKERDRYIPLEDYL